MAIAIDSERDYVDQVAVRRGADVVDRRRLTRDAVLPWHRLSRRLSSAPLGSQVRH